MRRVAVCVLALAFAPAANAAPFSLELRPLPAATYGDPVVVRGVVTPALVDAPVTILRDGAPVASARTGPQGAFAVRLRADGPATFVATAGELTSAPAALAVRPRLIARVLGSGIVGGRLRVEAHAQPALPIRVEVRRDGRMTFAETFERAARVGLSTRRPASFRVRVVADPRNGWAAAVRTLTAAAVRPTLGPGSRGASVRALEARLRELRYALPRVDGHYGADTVEAVLAFQKVNRLPWTGRVDARVWRALGRARAPRARYGGDHIEVSKGSQYLFVVRGGQVRLVVHVSTGATGNTPLGHWRVYRKVTGWDWVLWYPMYFLRGFAIHGYPSVPSYPASHGCVRVPMWVAPQLYAGMTYGDSVYVYW